MRRARHRGFSRLADAKGVVSIEFAFILPLLLVIAFGLIDFGRAIQTQTTLNYAAQSTARCYAVDFGKGTPVDSCGNCGDGAGSRSVAAAQAYGLCKALGLTTPVSGANPFTVTPNGCGPLGTGVLVTASLPFNFFYGAGVTPVRATGSGIPTSVTLGSTACYPVPG